MSNSTIISGVAEMRAFIRRVYLLGFVFVLLGVLNTFVGIRHLEGQLRQHIEKTITLKLGQVMGKVSLSLLNVESMLGAAEAVIALEAEDDEVVKFFDQLLADNSSFLAMYLSSPQNHTIYANRYFSWDPSTVDSTSRPWYQAAVAEGRIISTQPYVDAAADRLVITIAKPIYNQSGQLVGVVGIDESLQGLLASLEKIKPSEHGSIFVFDKAGQALLGGLTSDDQVTPRILSEPTGVLSITIDGHEGYLKWQTVGSSGIVLGLFAPLRDFMDYGVLVAQALGTMILSLTILALVLLVFQRRYITRPMRELDRDIMAISLERDVAYRLPVRRRSPFEQLRSSINDGLARVQEHFEYIIQQQDELTAAYGQLVAHETQLQEHYKAIKEAEERIHFLADHDVLTGLANRRKFEADLAGLLAAGQTGAVLLMDLDNFKSINDTLGHVYGDMVLRCLAGVLEEDFDSKAATYRFGGDEFLIILKDVVEPLELGDIIECGLQSLTQPRTIDGKRNRISSSVGVVRYPYDGMTVEQLMIKADIALHNAKAKGRNRYVFFEASMSTDFADHVHMQHILKEAVRTHGFRLLYQPIVDAVSGKIAYLEALIRLKDHDVSPTVFIAAAEESNLIQPIGRWVIKEAIGQIAAWRRAGRELRPISINLSPKQFYDEGLVDFLLRELRTHDIEPGLIEMEITETVLIDSTTEAERIIDGIRRLGIKVALDDFGTGYLSIKYITTMHVDRIKLDQGMIRGLPENLPVMEGLITIAHSLGMDVVAEGVERVQEAHQIARIRCDYLQGYLFSEPRPADEVELMLGASFTEYLD